jgi:hypothetical protein
VTFNDAGSGPLHKGAAVCSYTLELINGAGPAQGQCAWSDSDGDKIFNSYTGKFEARRGVWHEPNHRRHRQVRGHPG